MRKSLQRGLSLFVVALMLTSMVPAGVLAQETSVPKASEVKPETVSVDNTKAVSSAPQDVTVSESQTMTTEEIVIAPSEPKASQNSLTTDALQTSATEGFEYDVIDGGVRITGYTLFGGEVVIPATLDGKKVLEIGGWAFASRTDITGISLPASVTKIGDGAFQVCSSLASINLPASVTSIGGGAFSSCTSLASISLPASVTSIDGSAFSSCTSLTNIIIPEGITYISGNLFGGCEGLKTVSLPKSLKSISGSAFSGCTSLKSISIPEGVISIGDSSFYNCTTLESINIPKAVTTISYNAFYGCMNLTSINVAADNLKFSSVGGVLYNKAKTILLDCPAGLTSLSIPEGVTKIEDNAVAGRTSLISLSIPKSMVKISNGAFSGCTGLTSLNIAEGITIIGDAAFANCPNLTSVSLPKGVTTIGNGAFAGCTGLSSVVLPEGLTSMGDSVFYNCPSLMSLNIPQSVTRIGTSAFAYCTGLTTIKFLEGVTSIGDSAFDNCTSLTGISLPGSLTSIGSGAFIQCTSLMNISIPEGVIRIGGAAFSQCTSLASVTIAASLTSIGAGAFDGCPSLTKFVVAADNATFAGIGGVLYNKEATTLIRCPEGLANISIPNSVTNIADLAFLNCTYLTTINIPQGATIIGYNAFQNCSILTKVVIPDSVKGIGVYAFNSSPLVQIYGVTGSYAEGYAKQWGIPFVNSVALGVKSLNADKASGQAVNTSVRLTAAATGGISPYQYKFYYKLGTATVTIQDYSVTSTAAFKPTAVGTYTLYVTIKDASGKTATKSIDKYSVVASPSVKTFITDKASGQNINTAITLTAAGADGTLPYQYKFYYKLGTAMVTIQNFSATGTAIFKPTTAGTYTLCVDLKDVNGNTSTKSIANYVVVNNPVVASFTTDKASGQSINTSINLNATGTGGKAPYQYKFYYKLGTATVLIKDFSVSNLATFKPTTPGTYTLYVQIKDTDGKAVTKSIANYQVVNYPSVMTFTTDKASGQNINTSINLSATGSDGKAPYQYKFYYKLGTTTVLIKDFSVTSTAVFKPTAVGTYTLCVDVKDANGKTGTKSIANYTVGNNPVVASFTTDEPSGQYVNTSIDLTAFGTAGKAPYQYKFYYKLGTAIVLLKDFSSSNTAAFKPITAGSYTLCVQIKDAAGKTVTKSIGNYQVLANPIVKTFTADKVSGQNINTSINLTATGSEGKAPYQYKFYYKLGTNIMVIKDYSTTNTAVFKPTTPGTYSLYVQIKDANGKRSSKSIASYIIK